MMMSVAMKRKSNARPEF